MPPNDRKVVQDIQVDGFTDILVLCSAPTLPMARLTRGGRVTIFRRRSPFNRFEGNRAFSMESLFLQFESEVAEGLLRQIG
jgi:hypothetical protein